MLMLPLGVVDSVVGGSFTGICVLADATLYCARITTEVDGMAQGSDSPATRR